MKKNIYYSRDNEVDFLELIRTLWKNKLLILSISTLCMLLVYAYTLTLNNYSKSYILVRNADLEIFYAYNQVN
jgi:LPS O-antigen subunit length determinant protein (WzzB/FepE family)